MNNFINNYFIRGSADIIIIIMKNYWDRIYIIQKVVIIIQNTEKKWN